MLPFKVILHPTDFSDASEHGRCMAYEMARDYGAHLILLHVVEPPLYYGELGMSFAAPGDSVGEEREKLAALVEPGSPVEVESLTVEGMAANEILRVATERHCDLIILGSHGRTGIGRVMMGSVAEEISRKAPCPVMIVRTPHTIPHETMVAAHAAV